MIVALEQRHIPLDVDSAEALVNIAADRHITGEKHSEADIRFLRDAAQQGSLILDRVADEISESHGHFQNM